VHKLTELGGVPPAGIFKFVKTESVRVRGAKKAGLCCAFVSRDTTARARRPAPARCEHASESEYRVPEKIMLRQKETEMTLQRKSHPALAPSRAHGIVRERPGEGRSDRPTSSWIHPRGWWTSRRSGLDLPRPGCTVAPLGEALRCCAFVLALLLHRGLARNHGELRRRALERLPGLRATVQVSGHYFVDQRPRRVVRRDHPMQ
jgi:hypothetical protein